MQVLTGNRLEGHVNYHLKNIQKSRFLLDNLTDYLHSDSVKICGLYGLRRTGKTIAMMQAIQSLQDWDNSFYVLCSENDTCDTLSGLLGQCPQGKFFIDEITRVSDFISNSAQLADVFSAGGAKITIAGTDSASILFTKMDSLYDRIELLHSTYISFAEFKHVLGKTIEDYIKYGGTLTDGKEFYNKDSLDEYTNISIVSNIMHSLNNGNRSVVPQRIYDLYYDHELESAINKTIEIEAGRFLLGVIKKNFTKSHHWGSVKDLMKKTGKDIGKLKNADVTERIVNRIAEQIQLGDSSHITDTDIKYLEKFLRNLDVLQKDGEGNLIFIQPGMQRCFAEALIQSVVEQWEFRNLTYAVQETIKDKINEDSLGRILENVVKTDVMMCSGDECINVGKFMLPGEGEFDLFILDKNSKKASVYEIKRSFVRNDMQTRHLRNQEFCKSFEEFYGCRIISRNVLYQGENARVGDVEYKNVEDFLCSLPQPVKNLQLDNLLDAKVGDRKDKGRVADSYGKEKTLAVSLKPKPGNPGDGNGGTSDGRN